MQGERSRKRRKKEHQACPRALSNAALGVNEAPEVVEVAWLLPDEVWLHVFSLLLAGELCSLAQTCRRFNLLSQDQSLWFSLFQRAVFRYPRLITKWREWDLMEPHAPFVYKGIHSSVLEEQEEGEGDPKVARISARHDQIWSYLCFEPLEQWGAFAPAEGPIAIPLHRLDPERKPEDAEQLVLMDMLHPLICCQESVKQAAERDQFKEILTKVNKDLWMPSKSGEIKAAERILAENRSEEDNTPLDWKKVYLKEAKDQAMANVWSMHIGAKWHQYYDGIPSVDVDAKVKTLLSLFASWLKQDERTSEAARAWWEEHKAELVQRTREEEEKEGYEKKAEEANAVETPFDIHSLLALLKSYPLLVPHFAQILEGQLQGHPLLGWSPFLFVDHEDPPSSSVQNIASMPRIAYTLAEGEQALKERHLVRTTRHERTPGYQMDAADLSRHAVKELDVLHLHTRSKKTPFQEEAEDDEESEEESALKPRNDPKDYAKLVHPRIWWSRRKRSFFVLKALLAQQQQLHLSNNGRFAASCVYSLFENSTESLATRTDQPSAGEEIMMAMAMMVECLSWQEMYELKKELCVDPPEWYPDGDALHGGPRVLAREPWDFKFWTSNFRTLGILDHSLIPVRPLAVPPPEPTLKAEEDAAKQKEEDEGKKEEEEQAKEEEDLPCGAMDFLHDDHSLHHSIHLLMRKAGVAYSEPDTCSFALTALQQWMDSVISSAIQKVEREQKTTERPVLEVTAEDIHSVLAAPVGIGSGLCLEHSEQEEEEEAQEEEEEQEEDEDEQEEQEAAGDKQEFIEGNNNPTGNIFRRHSTTLYPYPQEPLHAFWYLSSSTSFQLTDTSFEPWHEEDEELDEEALNAFDEEFLQEMTELTQEECADATSEPDEEEEEEEEEESEYGSSEDLDPWDEPVPRYIKKNFGKQSQFLFQLLSVNAKEERRESGSNEPLPEATPELRVGPHSPKFLYRMNTK